jgi:formyl-CoA transferase
VIGREDLIGDARFETPAARAERADEVNEMIVAWITRHSKQECMEIIGSAGVPAGAVLDMLELYNDPTFERRQIRPSNIRGRGVDSPGSGYSQI